MMEKMNYYMFLKNSPWPFMMSFGFMNLVMSLLMLMKSSNIIPLIFSINLMVLMMIFWFLDLGKEVNILGMESLNLENTIKMFFILFIVSEIMIFISLFWSNYWFFLVPEYNPLIYSKNSIKFFDYSVMPLINTIILILSSVTITISHQMFNNNETVKMKKFLLLTIILGISFTMLQLMEYNSSFFNINDSCYGSIFFLLTGLHGFHVMVGSLILIFCYFKSIYMDNFMMKFESFEMGSWYWHFVDLIWLFVIYSLYYLNN